MSKYSYFLRFTSEGGADWYVVDISKRSAENDWDGEVLFKHPYSETELDDSGEPPMAVREVYERLIGHVPGQQQEPALNLVEMAAEDDDCAFDQPCAYGHRVEGHAVYCHNTSWLYSPRKCRRSWYTGGEVRDEDCKGYRPNPLFTSSPTSEASPGSPPPSAPR